MHIILIYNVKVTHEFSTVLWSNLLIVLGKVTIVLHDVVLGGNMLIHVSGKLFICVNFTY